jgi:hypothetical protein
VATAESVGPALFTLGALAVILFLSRRRLSNEALAAATILIPFAFYVVAFYLGQDVMYVPHATHPPYFMYNARFGAEMAAPAAVFMATLVEPARRRLSLRWLPLAEIVLALAIIVQSVVTAWGGVISLQDGQTGASCYPGHAVVAYLAQHYDGGRILIDVYHSQLDLSPAKVAFRDEIYEGDGAVWADALQTPSRYVEWIIVAPNDLISQRIDTQSLTFRSDYTLVAVDNTESMTLWRLKGLPPVPNRPLSDDAVAQYAACNHAKDTPLAVVGAPMGQAPPVAATVHDAKQETKYS